MTLYATPKGLRYHSEWYCEGLNAWYAQRGMDNPPPTVTHTEASRRGLLPCRTCHPPPLLRVVS